MLLERNRELADALNKAQSESASRAGFERLAEERAHTIEHAVNDLAISRAELQQKTDEARAAASTIADLNATLTGERRTLPEKLHLLEAARGTFSEHFKTLAGDVLKGEKQTLSETNKTQIDAILTPLKDEIEKFRGKVEQAQTESNTGVTKLETLVGELARQCKDIGDKADGLATAFRGSAKAQGDWGEFILRDLLEKSGLREGDQYTFQERFAEPDDENSPRVSITDVVVNLPGGRHLVIDSKVSLNSYADSVDASDEESRQQSIRLHVASVRTHVSELAAKSYQELSSLETLGFVVMFVPIEPAFFAAIKGDDRLWSDAYHQKVLLVGPSTLLFVIRMVHELWDQDKKAENYREILDRGSKLYDKFVGFLADLDSVGGGLQIALQGLQGARSKLKESDTSLVRQVERLRELGVSPKVKRKGKKAIQAVIPRQWLDTTIANSGALALESSTEDSEGSEEAEEPQESDAQAPLAGE
ncbi:MAG TPA: DNA recombination protein RmuC [Terracidiphilus sp.]